MKYFIICILMLCFTSQALAQLDDTQAAIDAISEEVATINQSISENDNADALSKLPATMKHERYKSMFTSIITKMRDLKERYETNPYIRLSAFAINLGMSVSVSIVIEIKDRSKHVAQMKIGS